MPPETTRTLNPLPFEHLEPKRFEDLARQLAYGFRSWRQLEATGRAGSDDGFDARGFEINTANQTAVNLEDEDELDQLVNDRLWLIQCKRERRIGPKQMQQHLASITAVGNENIHGILFVAACDFSLNTRNVLRGWCITNQIAEWHIWGKAELEDQLFQAKNDSVLFAYFGISLQMRRQKISTALRRTTTIKRKIKRIIDSKLVKGTPVIVRDPTDDRFPYGLDAPPEQAGCLWRVVYAKGLGVYGMRVMSRRHLAYYNSDNESWDFASALNLAEPAERDDPWRHLKSNDHNSLYDHEIRQFWLSLEENHRYYANCIVEIPYDDIHEIDETGDSVCDHATVFVNFKNGQMPIGRNVQYILEPSRPHAQAGYIERDMHVRVFPDNMRNLEWEIPWAERNNVKLSSEMLTPFKKQR